jgi:hypothetical protein
VARLSVTSSLMTAPSTSTTIAFSTDISSDLLPTNSRWNENRAPLSTKKATKTERA